jgi:sugar phosphate isomerase/epimerase
VVTRDWFRLLAMSARRREFFKWMGLLGLNFVLPSARNGASATSLPVLTDSAACPFRLAVINDEITQDFEKACQIAAQEFGLSWIELRSMWNKNVTTLSDKEIEEARKILAAHKLRVTDIASPLFKTDWPGAPLSKLAERRDQFHANFDMSAQDKLLDDCIRLAKTFETERIRCFDFWRLEDAKPYRTAINAKLQQAAERCAGHGLILLLENEMTCNTATGEEAAAVLQAIPNANFLLNWDPGNAAAAGSIPYPNGYDLLPKERIGHCHCKDVVSKAGGGYDWAPVGAGTVDWVGQLRAMQRDGFRYGLSLETHWKGGGSPEASTRISMEGLKKSLAKAGIGC